jgi:hypothetical protein
MLEGVRRDALIGAWLLFVLALATAATTQAIGDWSFTDAAGDTLRSSRWAYTYVDNPIAQTGPFTILLAAIIGPLGAPPVRIGIFAAACVVLVLLYRMARERVNGSWRLVIGGAALAVWWPQLAGFGHLDDALILVVAVFAMRAAERDDTLAAGVLSGVACALKPTAIFLLVFTIPERGKSWTPFVVAASIAVLPWLPFLVGSGSLEGFKPSVGVQPDSVLNLFVEAHSRPSSMLRAVQMAAVLGIAAAAFKRAGVWSVLLAATATRLLFEAGTWSYYTPGFVLGAFLWEMHNTTRRVPWLTIAAAVMLPTGALVDSADARLWLRLTICLIAVSVALRRPSDAPAGFGVADQVGAVGTGVGDVVDDHFAHRPVEAAT